MKEKNIIYQLNKLKDIKPDSEWKKSNRELLYSQISAQADQDATIGWFKAFERKLSLNFMRVSQPAVTVFLIILFIFGGSVISLRAARDTKPGDSLYIAKIISEKTQYALTFNEEQKVRLGLEFAGNRAKEITQVLAGEKSEDNVGKVEKLKNDFKKELDQAKTRLTKINKEKKASVPVGVKESRDVSREDVALIEAEDEDGDGQMFSANLKKDDKGVEISERAPLSADPEITTEPKKEDASPEAPAVIKEGENEEEVLEDTAISTPEIEATTTEEVSGEGDAPSNPEKILNEAGEFLDQEDYDATLNKLNEAGEAINNVESDPGEVKGESAAAPEEGEVLTETEGAGSGEAESSASSTGQ